MKKVMFSIFILIMYFFIVMAYSKGRYTESEATKVIVSENIPKTEVAVLFFPKLPEVELAQYEVIIEKQETKEKKIKKIIDKLIEGPNNGNYLPVIPVGTEINNVNINNGIVKLDFSSELVENHPGGSMGEHNTIYSIIDSVLETGEIEKVEITIDGQPLPELESEELFLEY